MPELTIFQIDAFSTRAFAGNPAAVVPLRDWLPDETLQAIAEENNLAETAFFVSKGPNFHLRWFTPTTEAKLCGHATLASAFVLFTELEPARESVVFDSLSGPLGVTRDGDLLALDFPVWKMKPVGNPPDALLSGLRGKAPSEIHMISSNDNYFVVYDSEADVRAVTPDFGLLETLHPAGVIITAPGNDSDCATRYFAPSYGIPEDPVTGSIHCALVPYWAKRLHKTDIYARQVSRRGGELFCRDNGDRIEIAGHAVKYLEGSITV